AVDVDVADPHAPHDAVDLRIDPAVDAEGEAVARSVDRVDHLVELLRLEAYDVEDRPEHLGLEPRDPIDLDRARREERAVEAFRRGALADHRAGLPDLVPVPLQRVARLGVDHRADIGRDQAGLAYHH